MKYTFLLLALALAACESPKDPFDPRSYPKSEGWGSALHLTTVCNRVCLTDGETTYLAVKSPEGIWLPRMQDKFIIELENLIADSIYYSQFDPRDSFAVRPSQPLRTPYSHPRQPQN